MIALLLTSALLASAEIDPKNLEPGCTVENAPDDVIHDKRFFIFEDVSGYVPCDNSNMGYRIRKAMDKLGKMLGMKGDNRWAKSVVGSNPYRYVLDRVDVVRIEDVETKSCGHVTKAYFERWVSNDVTICASAKYLSDLALMALLLHEARHADNKPHVPCDFGPISMVPGYHGCDPAIEYVGETGDDPYDRPSPPTAGAYGVSTEFYLAAMKESSLTPAERQEARSEAVEHLMGRFNKLPDGLQFAAVMYPRSGGVYIWDGREETRILNRLPKDMILSVGNFQPTAISKDNGGLFAFDYRPGEWTTWKNRDMQDLMHIKRELLDQAEFGDMSCYLFKRQITCRSNATGASATWPFKNRKPLRFLIADRTVMDRDAKPGLNAYLIETNGRTTVLNTEFEKFKAETPFREEDIVMKHYAAATRDTVSFPRSSTFPYRHLGIRIEDGTLLSEDMEGTQRELFDFKLGPLNRMTGPTVWSPLLENL